jgi:beta-glucosidase
MYKAVMYIKERYGNPTMILSENGMSYYYTSWFLI